MAVAWLESMRTLHGSYHASRIHVVERSRDDLNKAYERCNDISQESRALICTLLKESSEKDRELHLFMYGKAAHDRNEEGMGGAKFYFRSSSSGGSSLWVEFLMPRMWCTVREIGLPGRLASNSSGKGMYVALPCSGEFVWRSGVVSQLMCRDSSSSLIRGIGYVKFHKKFTSKTDTSTDDVIMKPMKIKPSAF
ncbi:hypothetical protein Tco_0009569 [Tanacetum coccineum]